MLLVCPAPAGISFEELARVTASPETLQGGFRQQKYLAALDTELSSSGNFEYRRGESIRWQIEQPIENELIMTGTSLSSRQGDDELLRLDVDSNPAAVVMSEILFAVLTAEWPRLAQYFTLSGELDEQGWRVELTPRAALIERMFERIELRGGKWLREIVMHEQGGDKTTIQLHDLRQ